jgi:molybdopterin synthase sulfur carrier subunit
MAHVYIPAQLRELTAGTRQLEIKATTVDEIVRQLDQRFPGIAARLTEGDVLARGLAVSIDGNISSRGLMADVGPQSEVHFLPAIGGG